LTSLAETLLDRADGPSTGFRGDSSALYNPNLNIKELMVPSAEPTSPFRIQHATLAALALVALNAGSTSPGTFKINDLSETNRSFSPDHRFAFIPDRLVPLLGELTSFQSLQNGWDGPDSVAPSADVIDLARKFLMNLPGDISLPDTTVSADGEVGFYWKADGVYIDVGFPTDGRISYYAEANGKVARFAGPYKGQSVPDDLVEVINNI